MSEVIERILLRGKATDGRTEVVNDKTALTESKCVSEPAHWSHGAGGAEVARGRFESP